MLLLLTSILGAASAITSNEFAQALSRIQTLELKYQHAELRAEKSDAMVQILQETVAKLQHQINTLMTDQMVCDCVRRLKRGEGVEEGVD